MKAAPSARIKKALPPEPAPHVPRPLLYELCKVPTKLTAGGTALIEEFTRRLAEDPFRAFEWGADAMQAAAELEVARRITGELKQAVADGIIVMPVDNQQTPRAMLAMLQAKITRTIVRDCRHPTSGSPMHTAMARELTSAWAKALEHLDFGDEPQGYWSDDAPPEQT